jgi:pilus assembly protein TadC
MKFQIPFTFSGIEKLKLKSTYFLTWVRPNKDSKLHGYLENCDSNITRDQYIAICLRNFAINFGITLIVATTILIILRISFFYIWGFLLGLMISGFMYFNQFNFPRTYVMKRQRDIEKNLISALQDMMVQVDSGIPLFGVMVNISSADYGELSIEFKKAVKKINAGSPEQEV